MLSRRNIRIKVMQCLYAWRSTSELTNEAVLEMYDNSVQSAYDLLAYQLFLLTKVAKHAQDDLAKRKAKLLPSDFDKNFTTKLYDNDLMASVVKNKSLNKIWEKLKFEEKVNEDFTRKLYKTFALSPDYQEYMTNEDTYEGTQSILLTLYKDLCKHEFFNETVEDHFFNWFDDESIVIGTMKKIIKALPDSNDIMEQHSPAKEAVDDFGKELLKYILVNTDSLESLLEPLIQNWDIDRVALIDMILIKMSVSEMMIFPSIPTKVSINEYVELTKAYSTEKSKEFVNGVLDKVLQTLSESKKITKSGRGLV